MNFGVNDPNFEVDLGISFLISSVNIQAEITKNHFVPKGGKIPFDKEIFDPTKSFFIENSTFIAPWTGIFTFTKEMFRESYHNYESNSASMYGYINGQKYPTFEIKTSGSRKHFNQGLWCDQIVTFYFYLTEIIWNFLRFFPVKLWLAKFLTKVLKNYLPKTSVSNCCIDISILDLDITSRSLQKCGKNN